jgi:hypothetical protein
MLGEDVLYSSNCLYSLLYARLQGPWPLWMPVEDTDSFSLVSGKPMVRTGHLNKANIFVLKVG